MRGEKSGALHALRPGSASESLTWGVALALLGFSVCIAALIFPSQSVLKMLRLGEFGG